MDMDQNLPARIYSRERGERPKHSTLVSALVARLLNHYWTANDPPAMRQAQIEDWLEDVTEFSIEHVEGACREWRRSGQRRPLPSDIRTLAIAEQRRAVERAEMRALPPLRPITRPKTRNCWEPGYYARYNEPWFLNLPLETQRRFKEEDLARAEAHRSGTEGEFVALCMAQADANLRS